MTQKYAQICTVIHLHMYCEGCVIFCGYLWGAEYVKESLITVSFRNCNPLTLVLEKMSKFIMEKLKLLTLSRESTDAGKHIRQQEGQSIFY